MRDEADRPHNEASAPPDAPSVADENDAVLALLEQRLPVREEARRRLKGTKGT